MPPEFTSDWFSESAKVWEQPDGPLAELLARARNGNAISALEVGVWEGRSTVWLLRKLCTAPGSALVSVDHFDCGQTQAGKDRFRRAVHNTSAWQSALELRVGFSSTVLLELRTEGRTFDLVYIDGSHHRLDCLEDAIHGWRMLKDGGMLVFDDYQWDMEAEDSMEHPKRGIDAFVKTVEPECTVVKKSYQAFIRKTGPTRHSIMGTRVKDLLQRGQKTFPIEAGVLLPLRVDSDWPASRWVSQINKNFSGVNAKLYIGVDDDDKGWASCKDVLDCDLDMPYQARFFPPVSPAIICPMWASLARSASDDGCGYVILWGDDVAIEPAQWMPLLRKQLPLGQLGCVAPSDTSDKSVPTFPIVTRAHFDVFDELFSSKFINQDADPYLYELYRRVGRAKPLKGVRISNGRGGPCSSLLSSQPRYSRCGMPDWKELLLEPAAATLAAAVSAPKHVTIDVVIPTYRTPADLLRELVAIPDTSRCSLKFIIIVDDPNAPNLAEVTALQSERVRVRVNHANLGASASRSRGLGEACAEWVLFIDDDVVATEETVSAYTARILKDGDSFCGYVGTTELPPVQSIWHEATRLSYITFFYSLPPWMGEDDIPWGVTANLLVRRVAAVTFDTDYAKTGGGEDVDYCISLARATGLPFGRVENAVATHDWWPVHSVGEYLFRFWKWTMGDGYLMYKHPEFVYLSFPNVVELSTILLVATPWLMRVRLVAELLGAIWAVEFVFETVSALNGPNSLHLSRGRRTVAAVLSVVVKNVVDTGHMVFHLKQGRWLYLFHRFDWFLGRHGMPGSERRKFALRGAVWTAVLAALLARDERGVF